MIRGHDDEERRLAMYRLVAEKVRKDPTLLEKARTNLARWQAADRHPDRDEWAKLLDQGMEACLAMLEEESMHADRMRMASPFVGILPEEERLTFLREWSKRYDKSEPGAR